MTDRVSTLTVILDRDMRDDDVEHLVQAIGMMRCVREVVLGEVVDHRDYIAYDRAKKELRETIFDLLKTRP